MAKTFASFVILGEREKEPLQLHSNHTYWLLCGG